MRIASCRTNGRPSDPEDFIDSPGIMVVFSCPDHRRTVGQLHASPDRKAEVPSKIQIISFPLSSIVQLRRPTSSGDNPIAVSPTNGGRKDAAPSAAYPWYCAIRHEGERHCTR